MGNPLSWLIDPFLNSSATALALAVCLLALTGLAVVGTWVVLRGLSFFGEALSHGVLPGVAVAVLAGFDVRLGAMVAAGLMVLAMMAIRRVSPLPDDTSIGVLFVGFLALAVVIVAHSGGGVGDLDRYLFGSLTSLGRADLIRQAVATGLILVAGVIGYRAFLVTTFDETAAEVMGFAPQWVNAALMGLVAVAIVSSFEAVGALLVFAFLVAPAATAALIWRRVPSIIIGAVAIGAVAAVVGLASSYHSDTSAPEASMAVVVVAAFLAVVGVRGLLRRPAT